MFASASILPFVPVPRSRTTIGKSGPSEGARLLWIAIGSESHYAAAARIGVGAGTLLHWLYCDRRPDAIRAAKVQDVYGVPADTWGRDPSEHFAIPEPPTSPDDTGTHRTVPADRTG